MGEACTGSGEGECGGEQAWIPEVLSTKVAGQGSTTALEPGDWFSYALTIDLPAAPATLAAQLSTRHPAHGERGGATPRLRHGAGRGAVGPGGRGGGGEPAGVPGGVRR